MSGDRPTAERLREVLEYDPFTGVFRWRRSSGRSRAGGIAGAAQHGRYIRIRVDGVLYGAHQLAWLHVTSSWPKFEIDHRDGDGKNNRFANLRDVPHAVNLQNRRRAGRQNKTGLLGVSLVKGKYLQADISVNGKSIRLGRFNTPEEAHAAYLAKKREVHEGSEL